MLLVEAKAEINKRLHLEVMQGRLADTPPDRLSDLTPALTKAADEGWALKLISPGLYELRRTYVVLITRDPKHQARAEALGEVKAGDNKYEQTVSQSWFGIFPFVYLSEGADPRTGVEITDPEAAKAMMLLAAATSGKRPTERLRDL